MERRTTQPPVGFRRAGLGLWLGLGLVGLLGLPGGPPALSASGFEGGRGDGDEYQPAPDVDLDLLLKQLGQRSGAYQLVALRFVCIESARSSEKPKKTALYDYMYVEAEAQRYRPYRQKHTGKPGRRAAEANVELGFPDSYSWTLMFSEERQHLFRFSYVGQEWYSLRLAHIVEFSASIPFSDGSTIYQWSGRVWVDSENFNFLKVEAEPGNQTERLKLELSAYRQSTRFLIFSMGRRPRGSSYDITFLNEYHSISFPDHAEYRAFTLNLDGDEEFDYRQVLRYTGYQFFDVDVIEEYLR